MNMRVGALAVVPLLVVGACSNPRCWTHDSWEVEGGCHVFEPRPPRPKTQAELEADRRKDAQKRIADNAKACGVGVALACRNVAEAEQYLQAPAKDIEAHYTVACLNNQNASPMVPNLTCRSAGDYAMRTTGDGKAAAIQRYTLGCRLYDPLACVAAARVDPAHAAELTTAACRLGHRASCVAVVKAHADPNDAEHRAFMVLGCKQLIDDACELLGRLEVKAL